jgi:hypothetical protein
MKGRRKPKLIAANDIIAPTREQMEGARFELEDVTDKRNGGGTIAIGKAYRRKPMIDILYAAGLFSEPEYKALRHYRHHADLADRSLVRDSLCFQRGGNGMGPTVTMLNAIRLVADIEAAAGRLRDILRAVVVEDVSLSQWAMSQAGAVEKVYHRKDRKGKIVQVVELRAKEPALKSAHLEIKIAAQRVESEISA